MKHWHWGPPGAQARNRYRRSRTKATLYFSLLFLTWLLPHTFPQPLQAAIAFDATQNSGIFNTSSTTFSHTCTGSNLTLVVCVGIRSGSVTVSDITYIKGAATVSLTQIRTDGRTSIGVSA